MANPGSPAAAPLGSFDPSSLTKKELRERSWLAVECSGCGLLLPLAEAGEISPFTSCIDVPHTRSWFLGVANLRGQLHGVVDLPGFLGLVPLAGAPPVAGWMIALNSRLEANCALRVDQLAGLRREDEMVAVDADAFAPQRPAMPRFAGLRYREVADPVRIWQEISLAELASDAHFLDILARP
ncbi:MAG: chemotaxis protein CheW [Ideonella sp.]